MPINPGIALGVEPAQPLDMLGAYGKAMSIKSLVDGARLQQQQGAALSQKMQFDAQDQALDLGRKRVDIGQQIAMGVEMLPESQRAAAWPGARADYMRLTGDTSVPEAYDPAHVKRWAYIKMDPKAANEAAIEMARQIALADAYKQAYGPGPGGAPAAPAGAPGVGVDMQDDGAHLSVDALDKESGPMGLDRRADRQFMLSDLINRNPTLAGTDYAGKAAELGLKFGKEFDEAQGRGMSVITGTDGQHYAVKNGMIVNGGKPLDTGWDPNKPFRPGYDKDGNQVAVSNDPYQKYAEKVAPRTTVNVDNKQQEASAKQIGEDYGKRFSEIQRAEFDSRAMTNKLDRLTTVLQDVETGRLTSLGTQLAGYAKAIGLDIDPKLGNKEAAQQLESMIALDFAAKLKGPLSDSDRRFVQGIASQTDKTPVGRRLMVETSKRLAERDAQVAKLARDYKKRYGKFDEGFDDELAIWSEQNPLFPDLDAVKAELQKRGKNGR